jgi:hypothetical protein
VGDGSSPAQFDASGVYRPSGKIDPAKMVLFAPPEMLSQLKHICAKSWASLELKEVQTVRAEGMKPPLAIHDVPNGEKAI